MNKSLVLGLAALSLSTASARTLTARDELTFKVWAASAVRQGPSRGPLPEVPLIEVTREGARSLRADGVVFTEVESLEDNLAKLAEVPLALPGISNEGNHLRLLVAAGEGDPVLVLMDYDSDANEMRVRGFDRAVDHFASAPAPNIPLAIPNQLLWKFLTTRSAAGRQLFADELAARLDTPGAIRAFKAELDVAEPLVRADANARERLAEARRLTDGTAAERADRDQRLNEFRGMIEDLRLRMEAAVRTAGRQTFSTSN